MRNSILGKDRLIIGLALLYIHKDIVKKQKQKKLFKILYNHYVCNQAAYNFYLIININIIINL